MIEEINPPAEPSRVVGPEEFGDDWSIPLESEDAVRLHDYFQAIHHLGEFLDWINFRVGGKGSI
jgi:hypothetical protein